MHPAIATESCWDELVGQARSLLFPALGVLNPEAQKMDLLIVLILILLLFGGGGGLWWGFGAGWGIGPIGLIVLVVVVALLLNGYRGRRGPPL